jgi:hypothetical protein
MECPLHLFTGKQYPSCFVIVSRWCMVSKSLIHDVNIYNVIHTKTTHCTRDGRYMVGRSRLILLRIVFLSVLLLKFEWFHSRTARTLSGPIPSQKVGTEKAKG